jgi:hypothetical protein
MPPIIPIAAVTVVPAGVTLPEWVPGDFFLTRGSSWASRGIRFGQGVRIRGADRQYCWTSHAGLIVGADGAIVEALGAGVERNHMSHYKPVEYVVVHTGASAADRLEVVAFGEHCAQVHESYGFLTLVSIGFTVITGSKLAVVVDGSEICSALVARSQERAGAIFPRTPLKIMPADLAKIYDIPPPRTAL